jgi:hypothetical protein
MLVWVKVNIRNVDPELFIPDLSNIVIHFGGTYSRDMRRHFYSEQHEANPFVYCGDCNKKFSGLHTGGLRVHRYLSNYYSVFRVLNIFVRVGILGSVS